MQKDDRYTLQVLPEHEEIHKILKNWAKWCMVSWHPSSVKSLEGRYRPPPMYEPPAPSNPPNVLQAHHVEYLIVHAPNKYGDHLRYWYIKKLHPVAVKKKLVVGDLSKHLEAARNYMVKNVKII